VRRVSLVAPLQLGDTSRSSLVSTVVAAAMTLVVGMALVSDGTQPVEATQSWEQISGVSNNFVFKKQSALLAHTSTLERTTKLGLISDIEEIPILGTKYDDGCDRMAGEGCKGMKMWVAKGAKYLPDPPRPAKEIRELEDNDIREPGREESYLPATDPDSPGPEALRTYDLPEVEVAPSSDPDAPGGGDASANLVLIETPDADAPTMNEGGDATANLVLTETSDADAPTMNEGSCDDIKDFEAWLECEEKKRK